MSINDQPICFISGLIELDKNHQAKVSPASYRLLLRSHVPLETRVQAGETPTNYNREPEACDQIEKRNRMPWTL